MENLLDYSLRLRNMMYLLCDKRTTSAEILMFEKRMREIYDGKEERGVNSSPSR